MLEQNQLHKRNTEIWIFGNMVFQFFKIVKFELVQIYSNWSCSIDLFLSRNLNIKKSIIKDAGVGRSGRLLCTGFVLQPVCTELFSEYDANEDRGSD